MSESNEDACDVFDVVNCQFIERQLYQILTNKNQQTDINGFGNIGGVIRSNNKHYIEYVDPRTSRKYKAYITIDVIPKV